MQVYAVASEDMDSLTFGSLRFLRHLMEPTSRKIPVMEFDVSKVISVPCNGLEVLNLPKGSVCLTNVLSVISWSLNFESCIWGAKNLDIDLFYFTPTICSKGVEDNEWPFACLVLPMFRSWRGWVWQWISLWTCAYYVDVTIVTQFEVIVVFLQQLFIFLGLLPVSLLSSLCFE